MSDDKPDPVVLVRFTLADEPGAQSYYLTRASLARRLLLDAADSGDVVELLDRHTFAVANAVRDAEIAPNELRLLGIDVGGSVWVQPPATGQASQRN
jgi:hypothetical protein